VMEEWVVEEVVMEEEWMVEEAASSEVIEAASSEVPPEPPAIGKACTCWFATNGADVNIAIAAAIAPILKAIPIFEFITI